MMMTKGEGAIGFARAVNRHRGEHDPGDRPEADGTAVA